MVRHQTSREDEFRWAQVESWAEEDTAIVFEAGRELSPPVGPGTATPLVADLIFAWATWVDGDGVVDGADRGHRTWFLTRKVVQAVS
jgi:hypothetical protein